RVAQASTAPGTVTACGVPISIFRTPSANSASAVSPFGAQPEPLSPIGWPCPPLTRMANQSPPIPVDIGSTTHCTAQAVTAASTALPPARSMSIAARVASGCEVAATPLRACVTERPGSWRSRMGHSFEAATEYAALARLTSAEKNAASARPSPAEGVGDARLLHQLLDDLHRALVPVGPAVPLGDVHAHVLRRGFELGEPGAEPACELRPQRVRRGGLAGDAQQADATARQPPDQAFAAQGVLSQRAGARGRKAVEPQDVDRGR